MRKYGNPKLIKGGGLCPPYVCNVCSASAAENPCTLTFFKIQIEHEMSTNLVKLTFCKMTRVRRKLLSLLMLKGAECVALELR